MSKQFKASSGTTQVTPRVRPMNFYFDDNVPMYWFGGDPLMTMLLTGLSATFPEGERMFVRAVRAYEARLQDPDLKKRVKAFIGQEAHHGKEHQALNDLMKRKALPVAKIENMTETGIRYVEKLIGKKRSLAKTCALEHFTAMFAEAVLEHPELIADIDERLKPLWIWHAIEESEHKAVAFDVFQDQVDSYWIRSSQMAIDSVFFLTFTALHARMLMKAAAKQESPPAYKKLSAIRRMKALWRHRKVLQKLTRHYLSYYRQDFHPSQKDSDFLRYRGVRWLSQYTDAQTV